MEYILKDSEYSYDASAATITINSPFDGINIGQIKSIRNLTRNEVIYTPLNPINTISLSGGVITVTFVYTNASRVDTDKLQITIDTELADYSDLDTVLIENQTVEAGNMITSDWFDVSGIKEITVFVKTTKTCVTSIQVTDDNVSANPDAFTLCAKDGAGTAISLNTSATEQGLSYTFTNKAEKMRVIVRNNDVASDTPYAAVK